MPTYKDLQITYNDAKKIVSEWDQMDETEFTNLVHRWAKFDVDDFNHDVWGEIREEIVSVFKSALDNGGINYNLDMEVGLKLYEILDPKSNLGFDIVTAGNDDVWRYLTIKVMPDLTFIRYPNRLKDAEEIATVNPNIVYARSFIPEKDSVRIRQKRFYRATRRIWLKTLWWYVYLSWQGSVKDTREVLKYGGTNIIGHFIERPGRGYRENLYREIMKAYSELETHGDAIFTAAAKLNLVRCNAFEPELAEGRETVYSRNLFQDVYKYKKDVKDVND